MSFAQYASLATLALALTAGLPMAAHADPAAEAQVRTVAAELAGDIGKAATWKPTPEQVEKIAAGPEDAAKLSAYVDTLYAKLPPGQPAAKPGQTEIQVFGPALADLPGGYGQTIAHFRPDTRIYGFRYVKPGEARGMSYDGLIEVDGALVFIPKAWRAFKGS